MVKLYNDKEFLGEMSLPEAQFRARIMEMTLLNVGQEANGIQIYKLFLDDDNAIGGLIENPKLPKKPTGSTAIKIEDDVECELISVESWVSH
jgi:hypothetical protein